MFVGATGAVMYKRGLRFFERFSLEGCFEFVVEV
jgi:hypothetical protein